MKKIRVLVIESHYHVSNVRSDEFVYASHNNYYSCISHECKTTSRAVMSMNTYMPLVGAHVCREREAAHIHRKHRKYRIVFIGNIHLIDIHIHTYVVRTNKQIRNV